MEYTEEVKTEADSVVEKYRPFAHTWDCYHDEPLTDIYVIKSAIQDRQSVLEALKVLNEESEGKLTMIAIDKMYKSLTQQIDYLKSKL